MSSIKVGWCYNHACHLHDFRIYGGHQLGRANIDLSGRIRSTTSHRGLLYLLVYIYMSISMYIYIYIHISTWTILNICIYSYLMYMYILYIYIIQCIYCMDELEKNHQAFLNGHDHCPCDFQFNWTPPAESSYCHWMWLPSGYVKVVV